MKRVVLWRIITFVRRGIVSQNEQTFSHIK